ncbi:MAG: hybrid sensor histidine kinase/response regulator [Acidobacteria bacterium]|nr:MAG: hybrid sensor histidine kinase/response regulator [Acidobacteriota bacterium]
MNEAPIRLLIVDDSPEDRELYRRLLAQDREHAYELLEAETGEEGLALARERSPDCLLLDYRLPDVDGLEFLARLPAETLVPVIVLTGQGSEAVAVEAMKSGAQDYLLKGSVTPDRLQHAVQNAIEKVALRRKVEERTAELAEANAALRRMYDDLEELVEQRTAQLSVANEDLKREIRVREWAEQERARLLVLEQQARKQAEEANRTKDEFLATLSHELRTPLNAILGWVQVLRSGKLDPTAAARALETIERNARVQAQLIADLLDVSRIITGKLRLDFKPVDLRRIIDAALDSVRPAADAKGIQLEVSIAPLASPVLGDADRLQQVIWNLLSNSIKFTSRGGRVEVRLREADANAVIRVSDTGIGIRPDFLPYVFDRFRQAEGSITRTHGGLGLGLSIVRHLIELHGGTAEVESEGEGEGATFTVRLPLRAELAEDPLDSTAVGQSLFSKPDLLSGVRVVVVEDEADTRELLVMALQQCGAEVAAYGSAAEALAALDRAVPDVLLSDIGMPVQDGYDLIHKLRARGPGRGGDVPAAALTAYARAEDRLRALEAGYQTHLAKPVDPSELISTVARLAGRRVTP